MSATFLAWITVQSLCYGIEKVNAIPDPENKGWIISDDGHNVPPSRWFRSEKEAKNKYNKTRLIRVESLEKQLKKFRKMEIKIIDRTG